MKILIIKTTKNLLAGNSIDKFNAEVGASWKIRPERLYKGPVSIVVVLKDKILIGAFALGDEIHHNIATCRTTITLLDQSKNPAVNKKIAELRNLIHCKFDYRAINPATTQNFDDFINTLED